MVAEIVILLDSHLCQSHENNFLQIMKISMIKKIKHFSNVMYLKEY